MGLVKKPATRQAAPGEEKLDAAAIERLLGSEDPKDRRRAAKAAAELPEGGVLLARAMGRETDASVLERIALALGETMDAAAAEIVIGHLRCENAAVRNAVIDLLALYPEMLEDKLPELMRDPEVDFRIMLVQVAAGMRSRGALERLCEALPEETDDNVCGSILEALTANGEGAVALAAAEAAAERFADHPFLAFAAELARDRVSCSTRGR